MQIFYRILSLDPSEHSMIVRYWTDTISEYSLATELNEQGLPKLTAGGFPTRCRTDYNITIYKVPSPTKEEIIQQILNSAPIQWLTMLEAVKNESVDTSLSSIQDLINQEQSFTIPNPEEVVLK